MEIVNIFTWLELPSITYTAEQIKTKQNSEH